MALLNEDQAFTLTTAFSQLNPDEQLRAGPLLKTYRQNQEDLGLPLFPRREEEDRLEKEKFVNVFNDLNTIVEYAPRMKPLIQSSDNPEQTKIMGANMMFMAKAMGKSVEEVSLTYADTMPRVAQQLWGKADVDDNTFFQLASSDVKNGVKVEDTRSEAMRLALRSAALGKYDSASDYQEWRSTNMDVKLPVKAHIAFSQGYGEAQERIRPYRSIIQGAVAALQGSRTGEEGTSNVERDLADLITDIPAMDRRMVMAAVMAGAEAKGKALDKDWTFWQQTGESFARLLEGSFTGMSTENSDAVVSQVKRLTQTGAFSIEGEVTPESAKAAIEGYVEKAQALRGADIFGSGDVFLKMAAEQFGPGRKFTPEEERIVLGEINRMERRTQLARQVRQAAVTSDPVKNVFASAIGSSAAIIPVAAAGSVGVVVAAKMYAGMEYDDLRVKYPTLSQEKAAAISNISGFVMSGLDKVTAGFLGDKLPSVRNLIQKGIMSSVIGRMGIRTVEGMVIENLVEAGQDITTPVVTEVMSRLYDDVPQVDWQKEWQSFTSSRLDVALGTLPLVMLGVGVAGVNDYGRMEAKVMLGDGELLGQAGFTPEDTTRITGLAENDDLKGAQTALREAMARRDPAIAQQFAERAESSKLGASTFDSALQRNVTPKYTKEGGTHTITLPDGKVIKARSWEEARWYVEQIAGDKLAEDIDLVAGMADFLSKPRAGIAERKVEVELGTRRSQQEDVEEGIITEEQAQERARVASEALGLTPKQAKETVWGVLGRNTTDLKGKVARAASKYFNGANVLTATEEEIEINILEGLASGRHTIEKLTGWVRRAEEVTKLTFLRAEPGQETEQTVIEAISEILVADVVGQRKDGSRLPAGLVTRGLIRAIQTRQEIGRMKKDKDGNDTTEKGSELAAFIAAWRQFFRHIFQAAKAIAKGKAEGRFGPDYQEYVDELLGVPPGTRDVNASADQALEMADLGPEMEVTPERVVGKADTIIQFDDIVNFNGYVGRLETRGQRFAVVTPDQEVELTSEQLGELELETDPAKRAEVERQELEAKGLTPMKFVPVPGQVAITTKFGTMRLTPQHRKLSKNVVDLGGGEVAFRVFDPANRRIVLLRGDQARQAIDAMLEAAANVEESGGKVSYSIAPLDTQFRFEGIAKEDPVNDDGRVGTAWQGKVKPTTQDTNDGIATVTPKGLEKQMAKLTHFIDGVPLPKYLTKFTDPVERMREFIAFQKANLLALYDAFDTLSADYVIRSTHWYDGARLIAERVSSLYNLTVEQSAAIIAVFSPMKDWFQNVAMGQRFADVMANHMNTPINKTGMSVAFQEMLNAAKKAKYLRVALKAIEGRTITELMVDKSKGGRRLAAIAVRVMSTHVHGLTHDVLSPEGESLGIRKNKDKSDKKMVWQSYPFIEKALSIYENGSLENISKNLGVEHKVRNFYNNIFAPTSPRGDATVDTHAVNAAVLFPMGGSAYLPALNFGDAGMAGGGNSGLYWLFHEALREAAAERGVLPRQMQSITWEAIRGLFPDTLKRNKKFVAKIVEIWESSPDAESARTRILELGITPPEWARVDTSGAGSKAGVGGNSGQGTDTQGGVRSGVRQGRRGGTSRATVGYSIAPMTFSENVQEELARALDFDPDRRRAFYGEVAKRIAKVADDVDRMAAADLTNKERKEQRVQFAQSRFVELLAMLPPNQTAEKQAEVRKQAEAEAAAWSKKNKEDAPSQRERIITYQRVLNAGMMGLPPKLRGKVGGYLNVARAGSAGTAIKAIKKAVVKMGEVIEEQLKAEYTEEVKDILKKGKIRNRAGLKPRSDIGAEATAVFLKAKEYMQMPEAVVMKAIGERDAQLNDTQIVLTPEERQTLEEEISLLETFGNVADWTAAQAKAAYDTLELTYTVGFLDRSIRRKLIEQEVDRLRNLFKDSTGILDIEAAIIEAKNKDSFWKRRTMDLLDFNQFIYLIAGENSEFTRELLRMDRQSDNAKVDLDMATESAVEAFFTNLAGGQLAGQKLRYDLATKKTVVTPDNQQFTQMEAIHILATWRQEKGKKHMLGKLGPAGASKDPPTWGYDQAWVDSVESQVSDEAKALLGFLSQQLRDEHPVLDALMREREGVALPQEAFYFILSVMPLQEKVGAMPDPVTGKDVTTVGLGPNFLRGRSSSAVNRPVFRDALQLYLNHARQANHWITRYDFARTMQQLFLSQKTLDYVRGVKGEYAVRKMRKLVEWAVQGGVRSAAADFELNNFISRMAGRAASAAILGRVTTLGVQTTQLAAGMLKMPVSTFLRLNAQLYSGQLNWTATYNSQFIQRRVLQKSPLARQAMEEMIALQSGKMIGKVGAVREWIHDRQGPNQIKHQARHLAEWLSKTDGTATAATYTLIYHHKLEEAATLGMGPAEASAYAVDEAERLTEDISQPVRQSHRSLFELHSTNLWAGKAFFAFASEPRKKIALLMMSLERGIWKDPAYVAKLAVLVFGVNGLGVHGLKLLAGTARGTADEDDWSDWKAWAVAMVSAPVAGFPGAQALMETGSLLSGPARATGAMQRMAEGESFEDVPTFIRDMELLLTALALVSDTAASAAAFSHLASDAAKVIDTWVSEN